MEKYEYKTVTFEKKSLFKSKTNFDEDLNVLGQEGWKLVDTHRPSSGETSYTFMRTIK